MATVTRWKITETTCVEEEGVVVSMSCVYRADGMANTYGDNRTLDEALAMPGLPVLGDRAPGNTNLALYNRVPRPVQDKPTSVEIVCTYKTVADFQNSFILSGGGGLEQTQTDVDIFGNRISLSYRYPNDYPVEDLRGEVYNTSINESVMVPTDTLFGTGSLYVDYPLWVVRSWRWHTNSTFWAGLGAGYWLCTDCSFTPRDIGAGRPHLWQFNWTFKSKWDGWPVVSKIIDPNTGNVPADVVAGVGVKDVTWYPSRNFNEIFWDT